MADLKSTPKKGSGVLTLTAVAVRTGSYAALGRYAALARSMPDAPISLTGCAWPRSVRDAHVANQARSKIAGNHGQRLPN